MKKRNKKHAHPKRDEQENYCPICGELTGDDPENLFNLGPTGHGPDICYSDADPGL